jgi:hypothetical protein
MGPGSCGAAGLSQAVGHAVRKERPAHLRAEDGGGVERVRLDARKPEDVAARRQAESVETAIAQPAARTAST